VNSKEIVWPGPIEWNRSCGEPSAEWKSIECSIGAAMRSFGVVTLVRLVMEKRILSPARARTVGPGHRVAERPRRVLDPRREIDQPVRRVEADLLHRAGIERQQRRVEVRLLPVAYGPERSSSTTTAGADSATAGLELVGIVRRTLRARQGTETGRRASTSAPPAMFWSSSRVGEKTKSDEVLATAVPASVKRVVSAA